jgi:formylglycine-generating enzyme required for sulfatase activity
MAGNVAELTMDWNAPYVTPCVNCADLTVTTGDAAGGDGLWKRGGSFGNNAVTLIVSARDFTDPPLLRVDDTGFRCARAP